MKFAYALFLFFSFSFSALQSNPGISAALLPSTESDPDAFVGHCVNVINGDYCESATDLIIEGPDALILQRFYNARNYVTGAGAGCWRLMPQIHLVLGSDPERKETTHGTDQLEHVFAFAGEKSGGILTYRGWKIKGGDTKEALEIDLEKDGIGIVNTYAKELNGQTNHANNRVMCKGDSCLVTLGDGSKRTYKKHAPILQGIFGEEIVAFLARQVVNPQYYRLVSETLPSGNMLLFSYNAEGHLAFIEMKNSSQKKTHAWIRLVYHFDSKGCLITASTSDEKTLHYHFEYMHADKHPIFVLKEVKGTHSVPCSYDYEANTPFCFLVRKTLPEGRFVEVDYDYQGRVIALKEPSTVYGCSESTFQFSYGNGFTDAVNALNIKTRYSYDNRLQLTFIESYDQEGLLYRVDSKYWGKDQDIGSLLARTIADGQGRVHSYRSFKYDLRGNVLEERLYGNLTGKNEGFLIVDREGHLIKSDDEECHLKTFIYSSDGFNLLTQIGDCKGNKTIFQYQAGSNLLSKKFICDKDVIKNRTFYFYSSDGVRIKTIEDDGYREDVDKVQNWNVTERHITEIIHKENLPGVGLPETILKKSLDLKAKKEILAKKLVNQYSPQGHLLSCDTYDANGSYAYTTSKTYNSFGQVTSETDPEGKQTFFTYDPCSNQTGIFFSYLDNTIEKSYDFKNRLIETIETAGGIQASEKHSYDALGRKISSTDRFGQTTTYEYDLLGRLTKVIHPLVLDEQQQHSQPTFSYTYDILGNALSVTDPKGYTTYKTYNLHGSPTKILYPDGTKELFKYDKEGSLHRAMTRDQIITIYEYDYLGRKTYEEVSSVTEEGTTTFIKNRTLSYNGFRLLSEKDANLYSKFKHDVAGRIIALIQHEFGTAEENPHSRKTEIEYDALERACKKKIWFGTGSKDYTLECFTYDLFGNIIDKKIEDAAHKVFLQKCFTYDAEGQCVEEYSFQEGQKQTLVKISYDPFGEPISYIDALGKETHTIIDYGKNTLSKTVISPLGIRTIIEFDALGRIVSLDKRDFMGLILSSQKIFYDGVGNKSLEIQHVILEGNVNALQHTRWVYGPMGRLDEHIEAEGKQEQKKTVNAYNEFGQIESRRLPGALSPLIYAYNEEGFLCNIQYTDEKKDLQISNSYSYDKTGNISGARDLNGNAISRTYNAFDQLVKETVNDGEGAYTLEYKYDRQGRLTTIILPDASVVKYAYDALYGREVQRLTKCNQVLYTHKYDAYDEQGRLTEETLVGNCGKRNTKFNANGNKVAVQTTHLTETVPQNGYNALGHLLEIDRKGTFKVQRASFTYNALSQLTSENNDSLLSTYLYDSLDNRVKANDEELIYNSLNQLISDSIAQFSYDPQGNLLRKVLDGERTLFESNILSQIVSIEKADKTFLSFSYDAFGRRVVKKLYDNQKNQKKLSVLRSFYYGDQELGSLDIKGNIQDLRIPGIFGDEISRQSIAIEISGSPYATLHDISDNVVALVDPLTCAVVESYSYTAFGGETIYDASGEILTFSSVKNYWRYAEKRIDEETGLIYFGIRYYDPSTGRWTSEDPIGYVDGPNFYAYLHNNPINHFDRLGLATENNNPDGFDDYFYGEDEKQCYCEKNRKYKRGGDLHKTNHSYLPTIIYCDDFEERYPEHEKSKMFDLSDLGLPDPLDGGIGFINGIWNNFQDALDSAKHLSTLAGGVNIHAVHNATHGKIADLRECIKGLNYIATEPVRQLHKMWDGFFSKASAKARFLMICHSQGAIHVRNALIAYPPELRKRIMVVAIAPAAYIYEQTCASVNHYIAESPMRDFVPRFDKAGKQRLKKNIVRITSHPDAPWFDHIFSSPTYVRVLKIEIKNYIKFS